MATRKCSRCAMVIPAEAEICPYCKQGIWDYLGPAIDTQARIVGWVFAVVAVITIIALAINGN